MTSRAAAPDPITLEILHNALRSVVDESFIALMKSAYSTNIKERHDHSTALMDRQGRLVAQAEMSLPIHLSSMMGMMGVVVRKFPPGSLHEGDILVGNDPYASGGTHLPDVGLVMPIFVKGRHLGYVANIAHHADMGGMAPGSMAGGMTEIYQEGLRIPVIHLFRKGELVKDVFELLLLNQRVPDERRGDYFAQVAACRIGERRLVELAASHSVETLEATFDEIITRTESRLRGAFATIPPGVYVAEDVMDDDGLEARDLPIKCRIEVGNGRMTLDFTGTARQVPGNINCTLNATQAAVSYTLKALLDPDVPNNQGVLSAYDIVAEPGTIVNCSFPASTAARAHVCQRIVDVIIRALADAIPKLVVGAANGANTTAVFTGTDPRNNRPYVYLETIGGGFGGRATKDGKDGVQVHITNTSNLPVEAIESEYPLIVESYSLVEDSGGAGRYRGGLALRRVVRPLGHTAVFSGHGERFRHAPWGIFGGKDGMRGRFVLDKAGGAREELNPKPLSVPFGPGDRIVMETPGAGGYGPPGEREDELVERDRRSGKFSAVYLAAHYRR
ncbi:MAG: hydantoinase B/oxoprolinase family protein [Alphaproteobacteria bacterium]|nr:hydantoinase B/oxoprolinase family protein [Alphaproteobacteria bacterium]